jgi:hypothetical protein
VEEVLWIWYFVTFALLKLGLVGWRAGLDILMKRVKIAQRICAAAVMS